MMRRQSRNVDAIDDVRIGTDFKLSVWRVRLRFPHRRRRRVSTAWTEFEQGGHQQDAPVDSNEHHVFTGTRLQSSLKATSLDPSMHRRARDADATLIAPQQSESANATSRPTTAPRSRGCRSALRVSPTAARAASPSRRRARKSSCSTTTKFYLISPSRRSRARQCNQSTRSHLYSPLSALPAFPSPPPPPARASLSLSGPLSPTTARGVALGSAVQSQTRAH